MGIKDLNQYLTKNCTKKAIHKIELNTLAEKVVAIDASIFIYRFIGEPDGLIPNLYSMVTTLLSYRIIPVFIFDGKTPEEKKALVQRRRVEKREAAEKYNELVANADLNSKKEIEYFRRKSLRLTYTDLDNTKLLLDAFGISYMRAPGEADSLCALLVRRGLAWGCMSEDMDLFLYGSKRVIRYFNLYDHTAMLYDTTLILDELGISEKVFVEAVVLTGTDYNAPYDNMTLEGVLHEARAKPGEEIDLYDHLQIDRDESKVLYKICEIFHIDNMEFDTGALIFKQPLIDWPKARLFLRDWGFIFI